MSEELKSLEDEEIDLGTRRRTEYSDDENGSLVLMIPKRQGGEILIPLLEGARTTQEKGSYQDNTLIRVRPLAELNGEVPSKQQGVTTYTGKSVAMLRPGFLYVFFRGKLWRELEVDDMGQLSDVDVSRYRREAENGAVPNDRDSEGQWLSDILLPVLLQGQSTLQEVRFAYSEIAWSWPRIEWLEQHEGDLTKRTDSVGQAYAAALAPSLTFANGSSAQRVESAPEVRQRDLGIELMLADPANFTPDYTAPNDDDLCQRLKMLWAQAGETQRSETLTLEAEGGEDLLESLRSTHGIVALALPDPLFELRHALVQLHLAMHYLDGLDSTLQDKPLGHSAKLVRQALFEERPNGQASELEKYREAIDQAELDKVLDQAEREQALASIKQRIDAIEMLVQGRQLTSILRDFTSHEGLGVCESYALCGDLLGVLQQLPGILRDQGDRDIAGRIPDLLNRLLTDEEMLALWSEAEASRGGSDAANANDGSGRFRQDFLETLANDDSEIDDQQIEGLGLQSLGIIAQSTEDEGSSASPLAHVSVVYAGRVSGLLNNVLDKWSQAVLKAASQLAEDVEVIKFQRVFTAVGLHANLINRNLNGELRVMPRGAVDHSRYVIVGVHGKNLRWGLTPSDRQSSAMTRNQHYLYADQRGAGGRLLASTSPSRMADELEEAIRRAAGHTLVFVLPVEHPEALKFSALRLHLAEGARTVVDGPAMSGVLVGLAIYNLIVESTLTIKALRDDKFTALQGTKSFGALVDLSAATMKLHTVLYPEASSAAGHFVQRTWFDLKRWPLIGARLARVGAGTIAKTIGLVNFGAGLITVGLSGWELRNSLVRGDIDAALGHGIAMAGGALFLAAPLMAGLLMVPGWGWVLLGLGMALGGGSYASFAQDDPLERLLKQGPLGTYPDQDVVGVDDQTYYPQLLTRFCPIRIQAQSVANMPRDEVDALRHDGARPADDISPQDYVVTVTTPLISRFRIGESMRLQVQELEYSLSTTSAGGSSTSSLFVDKVRELRRVEKRQVLPEKSAVRFLARREVMPSHSSGIFGSKMSNGALRVAVQAHIDTELGSMVLPTPSLEKYETFQAGDHGQPPEVETGYQNPIIDMMASMFMGQDTTPYWSITEVEVRL
ncbi:hypothetical protein SAMN05216571_101286 [Onishia taeanensis]|uniref:Toxin VasX N-terminal region domain-containing protein n=1 Tax=Onishia taeanensis TaxID=284577 RepID=A0A1G7NAE3_9GAMM|nr:toxin VasX [Halomonas taeanensis]SDF70280.1 hypothetical protein SAMN05216571_101286 [Halomonas taeanensis]